MNDISNILEKYSKGGRENLIPLLQDIQEREGHLSKETIVKVSNLLNIPSSKIFGVATFYNQFKFQPSGKYHIQICRGTACHVLGSATVLQEIEKQLKIKAGETTRDGLFSIEIVACIGACGLAPVISVNGEFHAKLTVNQIADLLNSYRENGGQKDER